MKNSATTSSLAHLRLLGLFGWQLQAANKRSGHGEPRSTQPVKIKLL